MRETVSNLHQTVSGLRLTSHLFLIGVDKTQSIALDEIFSSKKPLAQDGTIVSQRTFRKSRYTATVAESSEVAENDMVAGTIAADNNRGSSINRNKTDAEELSEEEIVIK